MKAHGRQLTVSPKELARLEQAFGPQKHLQPRTDATLRTDRRLHPDAHEHDVKWADNHYSEIPVPCPGCDKPTKHFVQARGLKGPMSVTLPQCIPCTKREVAESKPLLKRRHAGKKSHTPGTDLL